MHNSSGRFNLKCKPQTCRQSAASQSSEVSPLLAGLQTAADIIEHNHHVCVTAAQQNTASTHAVQLPRYNSRAATAQLPHVEHAHG